MRDDPPTRILVIDDNPRNIALLRAQLEEERYTVLSATTGRAGLDRAVESLPDLILLDIMMPGMDGYEVCRQLKADESLRGIPVIMLTSLHETMDKIRALEAGADDFLARPVDRAELLARVRSPLRQQRLHGELARRSDELAQQAEQLAVEKNRAEAILYSMSDGVLATDQQGRVTLLNPAAESIAGVTLDAALGCDWRDALRVRQATGESLDDRDCPVSEALTTGKAVAARELSIWRADDREVAISVSAAPVRRAGGPPVGAVAVFRDVTQQREVERLKASFVSLVTHELRTPLASIFGFAELLLQRALLNDETRAWMEIIHQESQRMANLISEFLEVERLESGRITYHLRPLSLGDVLVAARESVAPQLTSHHLLLHLPPERLTVRADADRLTQVVLNLLSNAIKYSPSGGEIRVAAELRGDEVVVSIRDQGLGLPADAIPKLFEKFYRVEGPEWREIGGTGLGLTICRQILEGMGGRIWADSPGPGQGSTFSFTLGRAAGAAAGMPPRRGPAAGPILVVKDDVELAALLQAQLGRAGYVVERVATGEEAVARARAGHPAAIVLDIGLAGAMDGWAVMAALRGDPDTADVPIIVVSGLDERAKGLSLGVDEYLVKPVPAPRLIAAVRRLVGPPGQGPVLVATADARTRALVCDAIRAAGFTTLEATHREEVLDQARRMRPLAILLDQALPPSGGIDVLGALRADGQLYQVPVVLTIDRDLTPEERGHLATGVTTLLQRGTAASIELHKALLQAIGRGKVHDAVEWPP